MAIQINIDAPENCLRCPISINYFKTIYCKILQKCVKGKTKRPKDCPIKECRKYDRSH